MKDATPKFATDHSVFGDLYVRELHSEATVHHLPPPEMSKVVRSLDISMFKEVLKSLRSTLSIRRKSE
jgi:hypothetical protein